MRAFLVMLLAAAPAAHADEALRAKVLDLLAAYEEPADAAEWRALGAGADAELRAIATDAALSPTKRAGAVHALGYFPTEANRALLVGVLAGPGGDAMLRRKAVYALGNGWGEGALPELTAALADTDVQLRVATIRALGRLGTPKAQEALRARAALETNGTVRTELARALGGK